MFPLCLLSFPYAADSTDMEGRAEPRFKTDSKGVVEVIRDKVYTFSGRITEVSGTGFQIEMAEPLTEDETVRLTFDGYHMLARVRHCVRHDTAYRIGIERVDQWEGKASTGVGSPLVAGRPAPRNPVDSLRAAAVRELFADPRLRTKQAKYQLGAIGAACVALAAWAGGSVFWHAVGHRGQAASVSGTAAMKALADRPATAVDEAARKAPVDASPNAAAGSLAGSAHSISIKASDVSWVSACADGAKVFEKMFHEGDAGEVRFARQATVRSGNAGALELTIGDQSIGAMGSRGAARTIRATPAGYEFITTTPLLKCDVE